MREYILYVILAFCPIGACMLWLLQKEGLAKKNILLIILSSLLMIVFFPIIMHRLGAYVSFVAYLLLVVFIVFYLLRPEGEHYLQAESVARDIARFRTRDLIMEQEEKATSYTGARFQAASAEAVVDYPGDSEYRQEEIATAVFTEKTSGKDENMKVQVFQQESREHPGVKEFSQDEDHKPSESHIYSMPENVDTLDDMAERDSEIEDMEAVTDYEENADSIPANGIAPEDLGATLTLDSVVISDIEEAIAEEKAEEKAEEIAEFSIDKAEGVIDYGNINIAVNNLIDKGFYYKYENSFQEMIGCFQEALHKTNDYELKYLLTMELTNAYKDMGLYKEAEEILREFLGFGLERPDIIKEINDELIYLRLLIQELERLGIKNVPVSRLPRWVRVKVTEEMSLQDIR